jgi:hypothetical protein
MTGAGRHSCWEAALPREAARRQRAAPANFIKDLHDLLRTAVSCHSVGYKFIGAVENKDVFEKEQSRPSQRTVDASRCFLLILRDLRRDTQLEPCGLYFSSPIPDKDLQVHRMSVCLSAENEAPPPPPKKKFLHVYLPFSAVNEQCQQDTSIFTDAFFCKQLPRSREMFKHYLQTTCDLITLLMGTTP